MPQLRYYQVEAVKDILHKKKVLIADDMGLGKTAESIAAKNVIEKRQRYDRPALVVSPASVTEHWEDQIRLWYKKGGSTRIAKIETSTYDSDVERAQKADFIVVGYSTLSYFGKDRHRIGKLKLLRPQYGIIDEAHNAKNPGSIRSMAVKELFDSMEYLSIMSGTPIPNSVVDIYMLLSLLDKEHFPLNQENSKAIVSSFFSLFRSDPEFVRRVLSDRMLKRTAEQYLQSKFPQLNQSYLRTKLDGFHKEVYTQIYENDIIKPGEKLWQLIKASVDPNLASPHLLDRSLANKLGRMDSSVYMALDGLVQEVAESGGKVLVFSDLKERVTETLKERYRKYGAELIDGDVTSVKVNGGISLREEIRRKFQKDPDCRVLFATTVMDEGVDLTAATDIVHLTLPPTPAAFDQRNRRSQRIGEVEKDYVNAHIVMQSIDELTPVITEGYLNLLSDKRRIVDYLLRQPFSLTTEDLREITNGSSQKSRHLTPFVSSPVKSIFSHLGQLKGQGFKKISSHYKRYPEEAEFIARLYANHWEGYYGGNTANLYGTVIQVLEESEDLERKLDIASGPFSLARIIGKPVANLDLNRSMLIAGRVLEKDGTTNSGNEAVQGTFHQMPFVSNSFDLAVCSLALHMSKLKIKYGRTEVYERESTFREMNRVLREGGYGIVTLPHTVISESDFPSFYEGLDLLGFEVLPFSGFFRGPKNSKFSVYLAGLRKVSEPQTETLDVDYLTWRMDSQVSGKNKRSSKRRKNLIPEKRDVEKEFVNEFFHRRTGISLEESIRQVV